MIEYLEQTSAKKIPVIRGKNVILVPFFDVLDMDKFIELHQKDKKGYMCRFCLKDLNEDNAIEYIQGLIDAGDLYIWNVCPINDQKKRAGFIYLTSVQEGHSVSINGIMDRKAVKEIIAGGRKEVLTFADDATNALVLECFNNGFVRVEGDAVSDDREAIALHKRCGFKQEGLLRKAVKIGDEFKDLIIVSIIKEEKE